MGNYKGTTNQKIRVAGVEINVPIGAKVVHLYDAVAGSSAADGFLDVDDNTIYSVTAGKTLRILGIQIIAATAVAETVVISTGDTENAETATLKTLTLPYIATTEHWYFMDFTLAAAKFLTYNPSSTGINHIEVIGYEY